MVSASFIYAGRASFVVRNPQGESVTVKLKRPALPGGGIASSLWVSLRHQNDPWAFVGRVQPEPSAQFAAHVILPTFKSDKTKGREIAIANWAIQMIIGQKTLPTGYTIEHTGRCGKCGKMLRDPESIALGLGPICRS